MPIADSQTNIDFSGMQQRSKRHPLRFILIVIFLLPVQILGTAQGEETVTDFQYDNFGIPIRITTTDRTTGRLMRDAERVGRLIKKRKDRPNAIQFLEKYYSPEQSIIWESEVTVEFGSPRIRIAEKRSDYHIEYKYKDAWHRGTGVSSDAIVFDNNTGRQLAKYSVQEILQGLIIVKETQYDASGTIRYIGELDIVADYGALIKRRIIKGNNPIRYIFTWPTEMYGKPA